MTLNHCFPYPLGAGLVPTRRSCFLILKTFNKCGTEPCIDPRPAEACIRHSVSRPSSESRQMSRLAIQEPGYCCLISAENNLFCFVGSFLPTYLPTYLPNYIHAYIRRFIHTCMHACVHACMHACMNAGRQTETDRHTHIYLHRVSWVSEPEPTKR